METVNHPNHYNKSGKKECIVEMEEKYGASATAIFCLMSAYKYLYRKGMKGNAKEDIEKARWYFNWCLDKCKERKAMYIGHEKLFRDIKEELRKYD